MYTLRTRFKKEIVAEFLPPVRPSKKQRVILVCDGAPTVPGKKQLLEFFSKHGFWAIHIHYRGSWESDGKFLAKSPHLDVLDVIDELPKGLIDLWTNKKYKIVPNEIFVLGGSFGGAASILSTLSQKVTKAVAISPGIDWRKPGPDEPYPKMIKFFKEAYGNGYRLAPKGWEKLRTGKIFNPINHTTEIDGKKLLIIHAKDDRTCPYPITKKFADTTGAKLITLNKGDHLSSSLIMQPRFYKSFLKFINSK